MSGPNTSVQGGGRLFVSDQGNRRVLIWNKIPAVNFTSADVVIGQPDFTQNTLNNGGVSARSLSAPAAVVTDGKRLFISDRDNHRVLIWNSIPTINSASADVVVGQPDFAQNTANNGGVSAKSLSTPRGIATDGKRLFVIDGVNNRVLIWNKIPTTNFVPADVVVGQPDFSQNAANNGGISASSISNPNGIFSDGKKLFVGESTGNNRVLVWNHIPTTNFAPADVVLGQPDFTSNAVNNGGVSARSMSNPTAIFSDGKRLYIGDTGNNRITIFNLSGSTTQQDPQFEQGKAVVGKVFNDLNGNGIQDSPQTTDDRPQKKKKKEKDHGLSTMDYGLEKGIEGVKVVSDTGIYAITDQDGKYHFPFIETGQHVLKIDPDTLPEGSTLTTDNPYKVTITKGILTKVSFGVKLPEPSIEQRAKSIEKLSALSSMLSADLPLLQVTITQDTSSKPVKELGITAEIINVGAIHELPLLRFTTTCNYYLIVKWSEIRLYDSSYRMIKTLKLPQPIPLYVDLPLKDLPRLKKDKILYYQLYVFDAKAREDRTDPGRIELP